MPAAVLSSPNSHLSTLVETALTATTHIHDIHQFLSSLIKPQYNCALICISDSSSCIIQVLAIHQITTSGRGKEGGKVGGGEIAYIVEILISCFKFGVSKSPMSKRTVRY
jgi:hypothetical protein